MEILTLFLRKSIMRYATCAMSQMKVNASMVIIDLVISAADMIMHKRATAITRFSISMLLVLPTEI